MLSRQECYKLLMELKQKGLEDTDKYFLQLTRCTSVPLEVIKYINTHRELDVTKFYEALRKENNNRKSKLYINIMKEIDDPDELLITLSSLITKIFIFSKELKAVEKINFFKNVKLEQLESAIMLYSRTGDVTGCINLLSRIKNDIKILESSKGD